MVWKLLHSFLYHTGIYTREQFGHRDLQPQSFLNSLTHTKCGFILLFTVTCCIARIAAPFNLNLGPHFYDFLIHIFWILYYHSIYTFGQSKVLCNIDLLQRLFHHVDYCKIYLCINVFSTCACSHDRFWFSCKNIMCVSSLILEDFLLLFYWLSETGFHLNDAASLILRFSAFSNQNNFRIWVKADDNVSS